MACPGRLSEHSSYPLEPYTAMAMKTFCAACEAIFEPTSRMPPQASLSDHGQFWRHHVSGAFGVKSAAAAGCSLCALLWSMLTEEERLRLCLEQPNSASCPTGYRLETSYVASRHNFIYSWQETLSYGSKLITTLEILSSEGKYPYLEHLVC